MKRVGRGIKHWLMKLSFFQKILYSSFLVILLPMVIFEIYSAKTMERIVVEQVMAETRDSVYLASSNIENLLSKIVSVQLFLYEDEELNDIADALSDLPASSQDSQERKLLNIEFANRVDKILKSMLFNTVVMRSNLTMFSSNGIILANYNYDEEKTNHLIHTYRQMSQTEQKTIGWMGISENVDASFDSQAPYMITLLKNMDAGSRNTNQVNLLLSIMENSLSEMLSGKELQNNRFLVSQDGVIISSNDKSMLNTNFYEIYENISLNQDYNTVLVPNEKTGKALVSYRRLKISPWTVVDVKPYDQVASRVQGNGEKLLIVNLLSVMVFLVIAGMIANSITRPLRTLADIMSHTELSKPIGKLKEAETGGKEITLIYQCYEIMRKEILNLFHQNEEVQKRKREMELSVLQAQIKPHFLFNTLMSIRCAITNGHGDKAADMTLALSNFLRISIVKSDEVIMLSQEIENLRTYLNIQNMRSSQSFDLEVHIEPELEEYPVPKLLFQPLIENAIVHGFQNMKQGQIIFKAVVEEELIHVTIRDNGGGFEKNPLDSAALRQPYSGVGVGNVVERIKLYYGEEYGLQYENDGGTVITLYLPVHWGEEYRV